MLGILGGGQLAQMMAKAARGLGVSCVAVDPDAGACAGSEAELWVGAYDDAALLRRLAARCDAVTFEFENVPARALEMLGELVPIYPSAEALRVSSDRILEKRFFESTGVAVGAFREVVGAAELTEAAREIGLPGVVKVCSGGYDGKGQRVLRTGADVEAAGAWAEGKRCIYEAFVRFERELSIVACRSRDGAFAAYPLAENTHEVGMLVRSESPADVTEAVRTQAERAARKIMERLGYVGVLAIEFFDVGGKLLANEMAPRVHNTGHWTIEGARTSQFENHVRAVMGMELGSTEVAQHSVMLNVIGEHAGAGLVEGVPGAVLHEYGKSARRGRKLGHVTVTDGDAGVCRERAGVVRGRLRNVMPE